VSDVPARPGRQPDRPHGIDVATSHDRPVSVGAAVGVIEAGPAPELVVAGDARERQRDRREREDNTRGDQAHSGAARRVKPAPAGTGPAAP